MTTFFTSDLHFGHRKVAAIRGFGTEEMPRTPEHDLAVSDRWRARVRPTDVVYILGDLSAGGSRPTRGALAVLAGLPGRKRLILGNHDAAHPMNREAWRWSPAYAEVFEHVAPFARVRVLGREVVLSHFPYERDRHEARFMQWRLRDEGLPLVHGHTHGPERLTVTGSRVEVHVGLDAWDLRPVPDTIVRDLVEEGLAGR